MTVGRGASMAKRSVSPASREELSSRQRTARNVVLSVKELKNEVKRMNKNMGSPDSSYSNGTRLAQSRLKAGMRGRGKPSGSRSSSFNRAFERKSKRIGSMVEKMKRDALEARQKSLGIHPS